MVKKLIGLGAAPLLAAALMATPALAQDADGAEGVLEQWVADLDALPEISVTYESLTGRGSSATLTGLAINGPELIMIFEPIHVTGHQASGDDGFAFSTFEIDRIEARTPTMEVNVVDFAISNMDVPSPGFTFDPDAPLTSIVDILGKVEDMAIEEMSIGRIDIGQFQGGLNAVVSYHDFVLTDWSDGRIASSVAGPLVLETPSPDELVVITVDELRSEDIDFSALRRVLDTATYEDGDRDWRTFLGRTEYSNIILDAPDLRMRIRSIAVEDIEMRQAAEPFTEVLERLMTDPDIAAREADEMMQGILVDLISPWRLGDFRIEGFDIYADDIDRFHIGEFFVSDLSIEGLGEVGLSDVDLVVGGDIDLRIDRVALGGLVMPDEAMIEKLLASVAEGDEMADLLDVIPSLGFIEIGGIELSPESMLPFVLDRLLIAADGYVGAVPTGNTFEVQGLTIPLTFLEGQARQIVNQLGYTQLTLDFGVSTSWDEASETLVIDNVHMSAEGAGSITASFTIGGVTRRVLTNPDTLSEEEAMALTLNHLRLDVVDEAVADRLFAFTAEGTDTPVEQYRDEFIRGLPFLLSVSMDRSIALEISPAIQAFLREPSALIIEATPTEPLPIAVLAAIGGDSPFALIDLLGVELSVEPLE